VRIEDTVEIARTPQEVFDFLTDPEGEGTRRRSQVTDHR
jgi:carbon monoxide dehydrogenase subunit G